MLGEQPFGGPETWLRWEIPFRSPACISQCLYDEASGAIGGWYIGPIEGRFPEEATAGDLWAEMLRTDLNDFNQERGGGGHGLPGEAS